MTGRIPLPNVLLSQERLEPQKQLTHMLPIPTPPHTQSLTFSPSFSLRIVLMDDAMDCLMSFSDFLFAFQIQFYYSGESLPGPHVGSCQGPCLPVPPQCPFHLLPGIHTSLPPPPGLRWHASPWVTDRTSHPHWWSQGSVCTADSLRFHLSDSDGN